MYFSFDFGWYSIHFNIVREDLRTGGAVGVEGVVCLTDKIR